MDKEKNNIIKIYEDENILNKIEVKSKNKIVKSVIMRFILIRIDLI